MSRGRQGRARKGNRGPPDPAHTPGKKQRRRPRRKAKSESAETATTERTRQRHPRTARENGDQHGDANGRPDLAACLVRGDGLWTLLYVARIPNGGVANSARLATIPGRMKPLGRPLRDAEAGLGTRHQPTATPARTHRAGPHIDMAHAGRDARSTRLVTRYTRVLRCRRRDSPRIMLGGPASTFRDMRESSPAALSGRTPIGGNLVLAEVRHPALRPVDIQTPTGPARGPASTLKRRRAANDPASRFLARKPARPRRGPRHPQKKKISIT